MKVARAILNLVNDFLGDPSKVADSNSAQNPAQQLSFAGILRDFFSVPELQPALAANGRAGVRNRARNFSDPCRQLPLPYVPVSLSSSEGTLGASVGDSKQRLTASFDEWRAHLTRFAGPEFKVARNDVILFVQFITKTLEQMSELAEADGSGGTKYLPHDFLNQIFQPIMNTSLVFMRSSGVIPVQDESRVLPTELDKLARSLLALGGKIRLDAFDAWVKRYNEALGEYATEINPKRLFSAP